VLAEVDGLEALELTHLIMLTGDRKRAAWQSLASRYPLTFEAELLPETSSTSFAIDDQALQGRDLGDGINDAPSLAAQCGGLWPSQRHHRRSRGCRLIWATRSKSCPSLLK